MLFTDYSKISETQIKAAADWCPVEKKQALPESAMYRFSERQPVDIRALVAELEGALKAAKKAKVPDPKDIAALDDLISFASLQGRLCRYRDRMRSSVLLARSDNVTDDELRRWFEAALAPEDP